MHRVYFSNIGALPDKDEDEIWEWLEENDIIPLAIGNDNSGSYLEFENNNDAIIFKLGCLNPHNFI